MHETLLAYAFLLGAGFPAEEAYAAWLQTAAASDEQDPLLRELTEVVGDNAQTVRCIYLNTNIAALDPDTLGRALMQLLLPMFTQTDLHTFSIRMLAIWECLRDLKQTEPFVRLSAADDPAVSCNHELLRAHFEQMLHYYDAPAAESARCSAEEHPVPASSAAEDPAAAGMPQYGRKQITDAFEVGGQSLRTGQIFRQFFMLFLVLLPFAAAWVLLDTRESKMRAAVLTLLILAFGLLAAADHYRKNHRGRLRIQNDTLSFRGKVWHANEVKLLRSRSFGQIRLLAGDTVICKFSPDEINAQRFTEWASRRGIPTQYHD